MHASLQLPVTGFSTISSHETAGANAESKVCHNDSNKTKTENSRAPTLVVYTLDIAALADLVHTPQVKDETVDQGGSCQDGKGPGRGKGDVVEAKVQKGGSDTTENDRELQPGQEGTFSGEIDLWLNTNRDKDAWEGLV